MIAIFAGTSYDFVGKRKWAYAVSAILMVIGLASIVMKGGLRYDLDFTGGTLVQVRLARPASVAEIRAGLGRIGLADSVVQEFGDPREFLVRTQRVATNASDVGRQIRGALASDPSLGQVEIRRVEYVGPQVGHELRLQALYAVLAGLGGILVYIAFRFDLRGGVAAVTEVFHDVIICLGALSVTNREFSLPVLAALLTVIGFSVNDTIVTYDRLRENRAKDGGKGLPFAEQMNRAVNQTLSRTVLTVLTVVFAASMLFLFGGKSLEDFGFVLLVGAITGTVSTVYVAGSIVVDWTNYVDRRLPPPRAAVRRLPAGSR